MKTAMQELIDELKYQFSHSDNHLQTIVDIVQKAQDKLEKEKEQIINTYKDCQDNVLKMIMEKIKFPQAEDYYNQTYNNEKD